MPESGSARSPNWAWRKTEEFESTLSAPVRTARATRMLRLALPVQIAPDKR